MKKIIRKVYDILKCHVSIEHHYRIYNSDSESFGYRIYAGDGVKVFGEHGWQDHESFRTLKELDKYIASKLEKYKPVYKHESKVQD